MRLLHLNAPQNALRQAGDDEHYKVLVLDAFTRAVIAPLLRVNELRKHGITLHLSLETQRDPIPDTPSIYFVRASEETVRRIVADAAAGLYDSFHLNFTPNLSAPLMEQLAGGIPELLAMRSTSMLQGLPNADQIYRRPSPNVVASLGMQ